MYACKNAGWETDRQTQGYILCHQCTCGKPEKKEVATRPFSSSNHCVWCVLLCVYRGWRKALTSMSIFWPHSVCFMLCRARGSKATKGLCIFFNSLLSPPENVSGSRTHMFDTLYVHIYLFTKLRYCIGKLQQQ